MPANTSGTATASALTAPSNTLSPRFEPAANLPPAFTRGGTRASTVFMSACILPIRGGCHPEGGTHALRSQARFAQGTATEGSASCRTPEVTDPSQAQDDTHARRPGMHLSTGEDRFTFDGDLADELLAARGDRVGHRRVRQVIVESLALVRRPPQHARERDRLGLIGLVLVGEQPRGGGNGVRRVAGRIDNAEPQVGWD